MLAETVRFVEVFAEWGTNPIGFVRSVIRRMKEGCAEVGTLHARCGGASTGEELQTILAENAALSVADIGSALRSAGKCVLVLDDLQISKDEPVNEDGAPTIHGTCSTFLDYCPDLVILTVSRGVSSSRETDASVVVLGPLDAADTRAYIQAGNNDSLKLDSVVDYDRLHRATGGLPRHIDAVADALAYTDLNGALFDISSLSIAGTRDIPTVVAAEVSRLAAADDDLSERAYAMLAVLCVLPQGESLTVIRRIQPQSPLWAKHAKVLQDAGLLDVIDPSPPRRGRSSRPVRRDKILRVPRVVRDHLTSALEGEELQRLVLAAASLYFGSDWKSGALRVRSRPVTPEQIDRWESGNELGIVLAIVTAVTEPAPYCTARESITLLLKYVTHLYKKGVYGEAYEAAREGLGLAENIAELSEFAIEFSELQLLAGQCARMIGEGSAAVELLSVSLATAKAASDKSRVQDVLLTLALAHESLKHKHEAIEAANEVINMASNNSADYLQAKAILAGYVEDREERRSQLGRLQARARNNSHFTVADNIAIELASTAENVEETLRQLALVRSRSEREYNYVRATIARIDALLQAGRLGDISELDERDLNRSYTWAYSQRIGGIFDRCHRVIWKYLDEIGDERGQRELFLHSSFIWRLRGDYSMELKYVEKLKRADISREPGADRSFAALARYCNARIRTLLHGRQEEE